MAKPVIRQVIDLHRAQLKGLIEIRGVRRLRKIYNDAQADLLRQLKKLEAAHRGKTFQAQHLRIVLAQVADGIKTFQGKFGDHLKATGRLTATVAPKHVIREAKTMEKHFTGQTPVLQVEQAAVLQSLYRDVEPSLLDRYNVSRKLYGPPVIARIRDGLAESMIKAETLDDAIDRVAGTDGIFESERWRAERIARTEMAYTYGVTKQRALEELRTRDLPDLKKTLISTFDGREGDDAEEQHMQIRDINEPFEWNVKNSKGVATGEVIRYMAPPSRPNDRAVMIPWREGWPPMAEPGGVEAKLPSL